MQPSRQMNFLPDCFSVNSEQLWDLYSYSSFNFFIKFMFIGFPEDKERVSTLSIKLKFSIGPIYMF